MMPICLLVLVMQILPPVIYALALAVLLYVAWNLYHVTTLRAPLVRRSYGYEPYCLSYAGRAS